MVHGCEILRQWVSFGAGFRTHPQCQMFFSYAENARCVALAVPWCLGSFGGLGHEMTRNDGTTDVAEK